MSKRISLKLNIIMNTDSKKTEIEQCTIQSDSNSVESKRKLIKSLLVYDFEKKREIGGQSCGIPINAIIVKSADLEIEIKVKHFKQNYKNKEFATLLMDLAISELVR